MQLSEKQQAHLKAMGITVWQLRQTSTAKKTSCHNNGLHDLQQQVSECRRCPLHKTRSNTVFGVGNENADILFIGEAPGYHEDQQGEPFVGRAGQLLNEMLKSIGLLREQVYIANILKCRPPNNRDPEPEEIIACGQYLQQQIDHIKPKVICAVGRIAAQALLDTPLTLGKLRGKTHLYGKNRLPLIVTYHPAYLLRNPAMKAKSYSDLKLIVSSLS